MGLRRLLLGSGEFPADLRTALVAEEPLLLEEGLSGRLIYRRVRAPRRYYHYHRQATAGALAVTPGRLVVWAGGFKQIDMPHDHPARAGIDVAAEQPDHIRFGYDASATNPARSGRVEVRLRTERAAEIAELLTRLAVG
jgi:hypothetical protein